MENQTPQQALEVITQVTSQYRGTRMEHETIAASLNTLAAAIAPKPVSPTPAPKTGG